MPAGRPEPRWQLHAGLAPCKVAAAAVQADSAGAAAAAAAASGCAAPQHDWTTHLQNMTVTKCTAECHSPFDWLRAKH